MQLIIKIQLEQNLTLPIAHHHILQAVLYAPLRDDERLSQIHDKGIVNGKREYKLFTFGPITGHYVISNHKITFDGIIEIEVRSINADIIDVMEAFFRQNGVRFGEHTYHDVQVEKYDTHVEKDEIVIQMISPICVHETNAESGYTRYFTPDDEEFYRYAENNFQRKYAALHPGTDVGKISLESIKITKLDKYLTRYKDFIIEGYKGIYRLKGNKDYLDFLYQVGLGEKNSQGFGMFKVID